MISQCSVRIVSSVDVSLMHLWRKMNSMSSFLSGKLNSLVYASETKQSRPLTLLLTYLIIALTTAKGASHTSVSVSIERETQ